MGPPEADRFTELRPFYQLCGLGLLLTALNFALVLWLLGGAVTAGVCTFGALALWWRWQRGLQLPGGGGGGGFGGGGAGGRTQSAGASSGGGGGGGSSHVPAGATNVVHQQGVRAGNGQVIISW